jgi:peptidyl-tRNA hydrolase
MSEGKLAAQVGHCVANMAMKYENFDLPDKIIVLKSSNSNFEMMKESADHVQVDLGYTEVDPNTETVLGIFYEE